MNPGGKLRLAAERTDVLPYRYPDFLAHVAGAVFVAHDRVHETENRFVVSPHQRAESLFVARAGALHQFTFGFWGDFDGVGHGGRTKVDGESCALFITQCDAGVLLRILWKRHT